MKTTKILTILVVALGLILGWANVGEAVEMNPAFTYQGHLYDANSVADGQYDFQFKLYDDPNLDPNVGFQVGENVNVPDLDVIDGYFTVELDFNEPNVFSGSARWLEIGVRPGDKNDPNAYMLLSPRQEVTPTPYALYAASGPGVSAPLEVSGSSSDAIIKGTNTGNGQGDGKDNSSGNYGYLGSDDFGVYGMDDSSQNFGYIGSNIYGVYGSSADDYAVKGYTTTGYGVYGDSSNGSGYGVYGKGGSGYAGYFEGNARVTGDLTVDGTFSASGVDADTLDTLDSTAFSLTGHNHDPCYVNVTGDTMSGSSSSSLLSVSNTGSGHGVYGLAAGSSGRGVYGKASNTSDSNNYGGYFKAAGGVGMGVYGEASGNTAYGVYGKVTATGDVTNYGGYFEAAGKYGRGVYGKVTATDDENYGGYFEAAGKWGRGIYGEATNSEDYTNYGGYFKANGRYGRGVYGKTIGVYGWGISGEATGDYGRGVNGSNSGGSNGIGVYGTANSADGRGVQGYASATGSSTNYGGYFTAAGGTGYGIKAQATNSGNYVNYGGHFSAAGDDGYGVYAEAAGNNAKAISALATGTNGVGVRGRADDSNGIAIQGWAIGGGLAGSFWGDVEISSGKLGIGRVAAVNPLEVEGNASKTVAGDWLANSDARIKTDIHSITDALKTLDKVRLVSFNYSDDYRSHHPTIEDRSYINVIAQEFREVFPDYVKSSKEKLPNGEEILQVDAYPLTVYSAAAVQELHEIVKAKDAEISKLKVRLAALEASVSKLARLQEGGLK